MAVSELPHRLSLLPEELRQVLAAGGVAASPAEARRLVVQRLSRQGARSAARRPIARRLVEATRRLTADAPIVVEERATDPADGFVKYLFRSPDGARHEAVRIPLHKPGRFSVCLSSQVGCAMACTFCATGRIGLARNLAAWEMAAAFLAVRDEAPGEVTGAVFQGQGEPFHNYDEVIRAARVLSHPCAGAVDGRKITISTVGLVPQIRRFTAEGHRYRLVVSLTSARPGRRRELLPVAACHPLAELAAAIRDHAAATRERVTIAWVLLGGVNDGPDEVEALVRLLAGVPLRINLIDVNDPRPDGFRRSTEAERRAFVDRLQALGAPIVRRYSGGAGRHAACGMLASRAVLAGAPA